MHTDDFNWLKRDMPTFCKVIECNALQSAAIIAYFIYWGLQRSTVCVDELIER